MEGYTIVKINCRSGAINQARVDSLVLFVPRYERLVSPSLKALDRAWRGALTLMLENDEFRGDDGQVAACYRPEGYATTRLVLAGLGAADAINADTYRRAAGTVARHAGIKGSHHVAIAFERKRDPGVYQAAVEGFILGAFKLTEFKGRAESSAEPVAALTLLVPDRSELRRLEKAAHRGQVAADGQCLVRRLAATPANLLTPSLLAQQARRLSRGERIEVQVLDRKGIADRKMGALLAVGQGSSEEPRFVILKYHGGRKGQKPVVLVGKGITFDSGGLSLKTADIMPEMKGDMTGAAIVLATLIAACRLRLKLNVIGLMPLAENMPSSKAYHPGDIITSRKGLTIEIANTDAEGRLILADALDFANEFHPQAVIDIATLTGAALYVLGYSGAPVLGNHRELMRRIKAAAEATAERVWEMPLWDDYRQAMKSELADLVNSGGKPAGTCTAAAFLENFVGDWPWVHVDIAYVDVEHKGRPYIPKGATGIGLRLLLEVLCSWQRL